MTREEAIKVLEAEKKFLFHGSLSDKHYEPAFDMAIEALSTDIIRCKDCKYGEPNGQYGCKCYHYKLYETHEMSPNDFCSRGCLPEIMTPPTGEKDVID